MNLVEVDYGSVCGCWKSVWNNNVHNTAEFDTVENLGLVCIVSVWTWIGLDVYQYFSVESVRLFFLFFFTSNFV